MALLRAANPVPAGDPRYADGRPLHHTAERALNQLLHRGRRARRTLVLRAEAAVCAVAALLVLGLSYVAAPPATAAPAPLDLRTPASALPLTTLAARADAAARDGRPALREGARVHTWEPGRDAPRVQARTRTTPSPHAADVLRRDLDALRHDGTPQLLDAVDELLDTWTLGARESAALARVLADADGLEPAGAVTDRLGRSGQAYVYADRDTGVRRMLILAPGDGRVLGLEAIRTESGDVLAYSAWQR
nr:hypothetical protein [Streptomyces sp. SID8379]